MKPEETAKLANTSPLICSSYLTHDALKEIARELLKNEGYITLIDNNIQKNIRLNGYQPDLLTPDYKWAIEVGNLNRGQKRIVDMLKVTENVLWIPYPDLSNGFPIIRVILFNKQIIQIQEPKKIIPSELICKQCGKTFKPRKWNQLYCSKKCQMKYWHQKKE